MSAVADYLEVLSKQLAESAIAIRNLEHKIAYQQHLIRRLAKMADENKLNVAERVILETVDGDGG